MRNSRRSSADCAQQPPPDGCATDRTTEPTAENTIGTLPPRRPGASGESRASRASELSGISGTSGTSGASGGGATPGLQPQNRQRENLRKVLPFALERKTGLALALRASGSRISADTPGPWKGRFEVACAESSMTRHTKQKGESLKILPFALERKTDFRPKHIPHSQSAHYVRHFPQRSLLRCDHHALVCIPMLSTKIRNLQAKYKLKIRFCAATAPAARVFPNDSIRRVARMKAPRPAGSYQPSVCGRYFQFVHR